MTRKIRKMFVNADTISQNMVCLSSVYRAYHLAAGGANSTHTFKLEKYYIIFRSC